MKENNKQFGEQEKHVAEYKFYKLFLWFVFIKESANKCLINEHSLRFRKLYYEPKVLWKKYMPELPDLQVFSRNLHAKLKGKTLTEVSVIKLPKLNVSEKVLKQSLESSKLKKLYREGKELRLKFDNGHVLGLHLMLHGKLYLLDNNNTEKHTLLQLWFDDVTCLALTDYQGITNATLDPPENKVPDALSEELNFDYLQAKLKNTRTNIKKLLMDQKIIKGIGNAYADEILWEARLSPFSDCNKIPNQEIKELVKIIKDVLKSAEEQIRSLHPDLINGEVRDFLKIHNPKIKVSPTGVPIEVKDLNSRKTYFTSEQKEFK